MSSTVEDKLENFKLTNDEIESFTKAFKKEEFRKLFADYVQEISDPENRARYEKEITQLEREKGMDVKFVKPTPGHVLKTTVNGDTKGFINVCQNENVGKPSSEKKSTDERKKGLFWSIPHLFSPPRYDTTKNKEKCLLYDFVVHPDTYRLGESNAPFRKMLDDTAVDGVEKMFNVVLDRNNIKCLKMKYKGPFSSTVLRNKISNAKVCTEENDILNKFPYPYTSESSEEKTKKILKENEEKKKVAYDEQAKIDNTEIKHEQKMDDAFKKKEEGYTEPKYEIKYQNQVDYGDFIHRQDFTLSTRPRTILLTIHLPLILSATSLNLEVFTERVVLISSKPAKYKLDISLPYKIDEDSSNAKFDKVTHKLTLTLPIIPAESTKVSFFSGDEGDEKEEFPNEMDVKPLLDDKYNEKKSNIEDNYPEMKANVDDDEVKANTLVNTQINTPDVDNNENNIEASIKSNVKIDQLKNEKIKETPVEQIKFAGDSGIEDNNPHIEENDKDIQPSLINQETKNKDESQENEETKDIDKSKEIVVIHEKECPKLHGILKCRTSSESSSCHESAEESTFQSKKSVSFSEHVDEAVFMKNQSVSSLHATLKNRKKKKEKREAIKLKQESRRRRKSSGSYSSGDELSNSQPTNIPTKNVHIGKSKKLDSDHDEVRDFEGSSSEKTDDDVFHKESSNCKESSNENKENSKRRKKKGRKHKNQTPYIQAVPQNESTCHKTHDNSTEPKSTMLSWQDDNKHRNVTCPIQLDNDQVFTLDVN